MLTKVEISTDQGTTLELPLMDQSNGYLIKEIEGLDPVKATMVSSSFALMDGEQYQSSRRESRNILLKLGLDPAFTAFTVRELRARLYRFMMPKSQVRMKFFVEEGDSVETYEIYGRVESFESPSFTKEPEAIVSLICHQPDFYDPTPLLYSGVSTSDTSEFLINYEGTVETGVVLRLAPERELPDFTVFHRPADGKYRVLEFSEVLDAGDTLRISTISGAKGAYVTKALIEESILYGISPYSNWINLMPGPNYIRVYAEGEPVPFTIEYTTKFGGI